MALALRLASYDLLRADGDDPILILDDVFAELDTERRERLAELVAGAEQVLVTAAVPDDVPARARRRPHRRRRREGAPRCRLTSRTARRSRDEPPDRRSQDRHDDGGLDLARSIARSLARPGARRRTTGGAASKFRPPSRRVDPQASGAHPDERDPQLLDSTIGRLIAEQGWGTDVRVHGVFSRWDALVGPRGRPALHPRGVRRRGKLVVRTDSTAWATQMKLLAPTVVRRLNEELGDGTVHGDRGARAARTLAGSAGLRSVRDGRGPRDTYG